MKRNLNAKSRKAYTENTPGIQELKERVNQLKQSKQNCGGKECGGLAGGKKKPSRLVRYSVVFLVLVGLVVAAVYGQQRAIQKVHLRRGFQQLLNHNSHKPFDDSSPLDNEMTLSKIAIVKRGKKISFENFENETSAKKLVELSENLNEKQLSEDNIVLLDKS